jgi:hypothetical protein
MSTRIAVATWLLLCVVATAGCDPEHPCDKGYRVDHGFCYPIDAGDDWILGGADGGKDEDGGAIKQNPDAQFGTPCTSQSECGGVAPVCGGSMLPICTAVNCESAGCPSGWNCVDVTKYPGVAPGVVSVCLKI